MAGKHLVKVVLLTIVAFLEKYSLSIAAFGSIFLFLAIIIVILLLNIKKRKEAEKELKLSEERLKLSLESSDYGIWDWDIQKEKIYFSWGFLEVLGYKEGEIDLDYPTLKNLIHEEDLPRIMANLDIHSKGETQLFEVEYRMRSKSGEWKYISCRGRVVSRDNENKALRMTGTHKDITEKKQFELALRESERKYRELADFLPQTVFEIDCNGMLTFANSVSYEIFGYDKDDFKSEFNVLQIIAEEDRQRARVNISRALKGEKIAEEYTALRKDGKRLSIMIHSSPIINSNTVTGLRGIIVDITERKQIEEEIRESEERYRTLIENQGEGVLIVDLDEKIIYSNSSAESIFGVEPGSLLGANLRDFTDEKQYSVILNETEKRKEGLRSCYDIEIRRPDKGTRNLRVRVSPYIKRNGKIIGSYGVFEDNTDRLRAEKELIKAKEDAEKSDRLKSEFLAQMSHEIRTPLNSILSFTSLLKEELEDKISDDLRASFRIIDNGGRRLIRTIDSILNMSQLQTGSYELNPSKICLSKDILENVLLDFSNAAREKKLKLDFFNKAKDDKIIADHYTVSQIFINLIDNAIKYTPSGRVEILLQNDNPDNVFIEIRDTGIGISDQYLPHLFTAFSQEDTGYTRKFEGNGLGLALVKKYAELNDAFIVVNSKKGTGTTFKVVFRNSN